MKTTDRDRGSRRVYGFFGPTGTVGTPGSADWTIQRTAVGQYTLRWSPPFRASPVITFMPGNYGVLILSTVTPDSAILVGVASASGANQDVGGGFVAEGRPL